MKLSSEIKNDSYAIKITATEDGKAVGWGYLYLIFQDRHDEPYGFMENIYVEEKFRGKGIGTKLLQAMIEEAKSRNCYKLLGTSRSGSEKVHAWYEGLGFNKYGFEFRMDLKESKSKQSD